MNRKEYLEELKKTWCRALLEKGRTIECDTLSNAQTIRHDLYRVIRPYRNGSKDSLLARAAQHCRLRQSGTSLIIECGIEPTPSYLARETIKRKIK